MAVWFFVQQFKCVSKPVHSFSRDPLTRSTASLRMSPRQCQSGMLPLTGGGAKSTFASKSQLHAVQLEGMVNPEGSRRFGDRT